MNRERITALLAKWEEACAYAHGGQAVKTPLLVTAKLIIAGDDLAYALKELNGYDYAAEAAREALADEAKPIVVRCNHPDCIDPTSSHISHGDH